jgi:hypothetical protein
MTSVPISSRTLQRILVACVCVCVCVEEEEREGQERRRREGQISVAKIMNKNAVYCDLIYILFNAP